VTSQTLRALYSIKTESRPGSWEWVKFYKVKYGFTVGEEVYVTDSGGTAIIFTGNVDNINARQNHFAGLLVASVVKVEPTDWNLQIAMRLEVYGHDVEGKTVQVTNQVRCTFSN